MRILYISYDGMLEPLGQSQVLSYLEPLATTRPIHLLSFEKSEDWARQAERDALRRRIEAAGIQWHPRRYHKRPTALATAWDIGIGILSGLWLVIRHRLQVVHARSYVAALMALVLKRLTGAKFVFDMRGFWADERVDGGLWPADGRMYRLAKGIERWLLLGADHVVSLTHAAVQEMLAFDYLRMHSLPVTVIPTCADLGRFALAPGGPDRDGFTLGYVGSAGTWYLFEKAADAIRIAMDMRPDLRLLVINRGEHDYVQDTLSRAGVAQDRVVIRAAGHQEVPALMAGMDAGIFFIKPVFSKQASAPTKLGEFLGCGVPCLGNAGVGDMADILEGEGVGVALRSFDDDSLRAGLARLFALAGAPGIRERCAAAARRHFALEDGVASYAAIYDALAGPA